MENCNLCNTKHGHMSTLHKSAPAKTVALNTLCSNATQPVIDITSSKAAKGITIPTPRPAKKLKEDITKQIQPGDIYIGEEVARKHIVTTKIDSSGALVKIDQNVYGRKIPLAHIRQTALQDQIQLGILNHLSDQDYENLSNEDLTSLYQDR
ncbi:unnamed protein product [Mytilus coruscus]|uniref:Uncharacterized protein n=1 Tax=Mytilus coruscus TaxID=42192 RepID=A0A6J8E6E2_MYTCO|nr:unnamed protein product [Mytilus coruscus]